MKISNQLIYHLQQRLKVGSRRGVHLNAVVNRSKYKLDCHSLAEIKPNLDFEFLEQLLARSNFKFKVSWSDISTDLNTLFDEDHQKLSVIKTKLNNLKIQNETVLKEKGINTFGFGYPIVIRRDKKDRKLTIAPLFIWSLNIETTKDYNTWIISKKDDDPIYLNEVFVNHLKNDIETDLEVEIENYLDEDFISKSNLTKLCVNVIEKLNNKPPDNLKDIFDTKSAEMSFIGTKESFENQIGNSEDTIIKFSGLFSLFEVQKESIIKDYDRLGALEGKELDFDNFEKHSFQPISSVRTDPSQQEILSAISDTKNILIQGPPGTGKSQSLQAVLINALENEKKVLVVCEKTTALEVLEKGLNEKGLGNFSVLIQDIVRDRKNAVNTVRATLEGSQYRRYSYNYSKYELEKNLTNLNELILSINSKHKELDKKIFGRHNWSDTVGFILKEKKKNDQEGKPKLEIDKSILNFEEGAADNYDKILIKAEQLFLEAKPFFKTIFFKKKNLKGDNPFELERAFKDNIKHYQRTSNELKSLTVKYKVEYFTTRKSYFDKEKEQVSNLIEELKILLNKNKQNPDFLDEQKTNSFIFKLLSNFSSKKKETLIDQETAKTIIEDISSFTKESFEISSEQFLFDLNANLQKALEYEKKLTHESLKLDRKLEDEFSGFQFLSSDIEPRYKSSSFTQIQETYTSLINRINQDQWLKDEFSNLSLESFIDYINDVVNKQNNFYSTDGNPFLSVFKFYSFHSGLDKEMKKIVWALRDKSDWHLTFKIFYLNEVLYKYATSNLPTDDNDIRALESLYNNLKKEQITFIKEMWYSKQIEAASNFEYNKPEYKVKNLYNKRKSDKYKRLSLRQIVKADIDLFTAFFPIVLTTPDVCSNIFFNSDEYFDLVLFDEASQLKLEDNLPALLKGKQIIIAGDEHQMPPSSFFQKIFEGDFEDEDDVKEDENPIGQSKDEIILSCESLLEFGEQMGFRDAPLLFHYRSKHPYLIDFSNHAFYSGKLQLLPITEIYRPIKYIQVGGLYSNNINEKEADVVLKILEENIQRLPTGEYPTVGVATFNIKQRNLILGKIQDRLKNDAKFSEFNNKMSELSKKGFFVKNLENIQGDERDVIILSTTYGVNKDDKFSQRFGPLNFQKGYKLLNVIITRAKYKIYVCTSIPEPIILGYRDSLIKEGKNNRRAVLYAYLAYAKFVSEGSHDKRIEVIHALDENNKESIVSVNNNDLLESIFEEEVFVVLKEKYQVEHIIPQLKFGAFRIDMVIDFKDKRIPKIAIECDGASYHSSQEAYLHDRHRQTILEENGFVFHRIWSTNWWNNLKGEVNKLYAFIDNIRDSEEEHLDENDLYNLSFKDDIQHLEGILEKENTFQLPFPSVDLFSESEPLYSTPIVHQKKPLQNSIKVNDTVSVRWLNNGIERLIKIVNKVPKLESTNGIQYIKEDSPLARSILGKSEHETVKIGLLDNFVEILKIDSA